MLALIEGQPILEAPPPPVWRECQGETKYHISNISYDASEAELRELLAPFGTIVEVHLFLDDFSRRSRGFACARLIGDDLRKLHGAVFRGRALRIDLWGRE